MIVEEFFELFKTPWEPYDSRRSYDAVIATTDEVGSIDAKLLIIYSSGKTAADERVGVVSCKPRKGLTVNYRDLSVPIYGELLTFSETPSGFGCLAASSEIAGIQVAMPTSTVIRVGYDLFEEVRHLLTTGQPPEYAHIPTLDVHIQMLRGWILGAGIPVVEIPPVPGNRSFFTCLTHDIDFVGIRRHFLDHSMWGFIYRATLGSTVKFVKGKLTLRHFVKSWLAVLSLPFVYAGWMKDFWEPFAWYLRVEKGLGGTYFLIPFKRRSGDRVPGPRAALRATAYDVTDLSDSTPALLAEGCELGVHGLDAWHDPTKGREELQRVAAVAGDASVGIRMHWLLNDAETASVLERAGYAYDSTCGYNETIGYQAGTAQVFRPLGATTLLELPMHIQDGSLFYPNRLNLSAAEAGARCRKLMENSERFGGVLTLLWHDRSHAPERFWGEFYVELIQELKLRNACFATAGQIVDWFRKRRGVRFERMTGVRESEGAWRYEGPEINPPLTVRVYEPNQAQDSADQEGRTVPSYTDIAWNGQAAEAIEMNLASRLSSASPIAVHPLP